MTEVLRLAWRADRARAAAVVGLSFVALLSMAFVAVALKLLVDGLVQHSTAQVVAGGIIASVALTGSILWLPVGGAVSLQLQERIGAALDRHLIGLASRVPSLELHERGDYAARLQLMLDEDRFPVVGSVVVVGAAVGYVLLLAAFSVVLGLQSAPLAVIPLSIVPVLWLGLRTQRWWDAAQERAAPAQQRSQQLFELATSPAVGKELRVFGLGPELLRRHEEAEREALGLLRRASWRSSAVRAATWCAFAFGYTIAVLVLVHRAVDGAATAGDVILVITLGLAAVLLAGSAGEYVSVLSRLAGAGRRLRWLADLAGTADAGDQRPPERLERGIELRQVSFSYPGSDTPAVEEVSLTLPAGTVVAVVGDNGAGKSTLVKLLCGLHQPTGGQVLVDDVDLRQFAPTAWLARTSGVFQDFAHLELTARAAVEVGDLQHPERLDPAAELGGATTVVAELPTGWDSQLGRSWTDGAELSTGQWQRLALARGAMRAAPLLMVLDEPTFALDPQAEFELFERFARASAATRAAGGVTVLVSHRFSTVRAADLIVVVGNGRVVESGSHAELLAADGEYAQLYQLHRAGYA